MTDEPAVHEQITEYTYSCLPEGHRSRRHLMVTVVYRGNDQWAVTWFGECLDADGQWSHEPSPSNREADWVAAHRFDLETAQRLAREVAPTLDINGMTLQQVLARNAS